MNNIVERDHRFIKNASLPGLGLRSIEGALRTIEGYEDMHAIRKGQIRWLPKGDVNDNSFIPYSGSRHDTPQALSSAVLRSTAGLFATEPSSSLSPRLQQHPIRLRGPAPVINVDGHPA